MRIARAIILILVLLCAACGAGVGILWASVGSDVRSQVGTALLGPYPDGYDASWHTPAGEEMARANADHFSLAVNIARCFPGINLAYGSEGPMAKVIVAFMLGLQPNGTISWPNTATVTPDIPLTNFQSVALMLSHEAEMARSEFAGSAASNQKSAMFYQWLIVVMGALATIFVSIKSMSDGTTNRGAYLVVGILAVVFSAMGTAFASLNSFAGPSENYIRTERALLQARQVQADLMFLVAQDKDICKEYNPDSPDDPRAKRLSDIAGRLKDALGTGGFSVSSTSGATDSHNASTSTPH